MPSYDYYCAENGKTVEVRHGMNELLATWGDVCERAGMEPGATPASSPVRKLIAGGQFISSSSLKNPEMPSCGTGRCGGGMCGL